jgi:hypothetical protein
MGSAALRRQRSARTTCLGAGVALALAALPAAAQGSDLTAWEEEVALVAEDLRRAPSAGDVEELLAQYEPLVGADARGPGAARLVVIGGERLLELQMEDDERVATAERTWRARFHCEDASSVAVATQRLARWRTERGEDDRAREVLEEALRRLPADAGVAPYLMHQLVDVERRAQRFGTALAWVERAEAGLGVGSDDVPLAGALTVARGQIHLEMGRIERAAPSIERGTAELEALRARGVLDPAALTDAWIARANLRLATSRLDTLVREVEHVLANEAELLAPLPAAGAALLVRLGTARADLALHEPAEAAPASEALRTALALKGASSQDKLSAEGRLAQLALEHGDTASARRWLDAARTRLGSPGRFPTIERAFVLALEARWTRIAGSTAAREAAAALLASALDTLFAEWRGAEPSPGGVGHLHFLRASFVVAEGIALALARDPGEAGATAALELVMRAQEASSLFRALVAPGSAHPTFAEARAALVPPGGGLLVYFPSQLEGFVFAVGPRRIVHAPLPDKRLLRADVEALQRAVYRPPSILDEAEREERAAVIARTSARLAPALFPGQIQDELADWSAVTVVGVELLQDVPLETLPLSSGEPFGRAKAVSHLPSLPLGVALGERAARRAARPELDLGFVTGVRPSEIAVARFPELGAVELGEAALAGLVGPFADDRTARLSGADATRGALAALSPRVVLLHVFTHGVWDAERDRPAGLVLAAEAREDSGLLFSEDVEDFLAPPLVVLTACGGAAEPRRRGDAAAAGLTGAFLSAGSNAVVAAVSDVTRDASAALGAALHHELCAGRSPAEALRRARAVVAAEGFDDPAYTDLMRVVGLGHAPVFAAPLKAPAWIWVLGSICAVLLLAALGAARRRRAA